MSIKKILSSKEKANIAFNAADSKKCLDPVCLYIRELSSIADYFLICAASSSRQIIAISNEIEKCLRKSGEKRYHIEGEQGGHWVLMDFGDLIVHIFHEETRSYYDLERLWGDAPRMEFGEKIVK